MRYFELIRTLEIDLPTPEFGEVTPARLEILRSSDGSGRYRFRFWELVHHRMEPSFPQDPSGFPVDNAADEATLVEASLLLGRTRWNDTEFSATSDSEAVERALAMASDFIDRLRR